MSTSTFVVSALLLSSLAVGCTAGTGPVDDPQSDEAAGTAQTNAALQQQMTRFTEAVMAHDVEGLSSLVSSEVHVRAAQRNIELPRFLEKQRAAIMNTFELPEGEVPQFEIAEVVNEGEAFRVTLRFRGNDLKKPFYFVREDGVLKLNIAPPGFSKAAPDGALFGRSSYQVKNENIVGNEATTISCRGGSVTVPARSTRSVTCQDNCGFWSGTQFQLGYENPRSCDWNSWGDDVYINILSPGGWRCNDSC